MNFIFLISLAKFFAIWGGALGISVIVGSYEIYVMLNKQYTWRDVVLGAKRMLIIVLKNVIQKLRFPILCQRKKINLVWLFNRTLTRKRKENKIEHPISS